MKKLSLAFIAIFIVVLFSPAVFADQRNFGCGLGSMMIDNNESLVSQTVAASLNGCFGSQVFGITSGTSNCDKPDSFSTSKKINTFVADNMDNLASDIAKGQGEYLETLVSLMQVPCENKQELYSKLQDNFLNIYPTKDTTHTDVIRNIEAIM